MSNEKTFTLDIIKPQLSEEQVKTFEHILYMAKELKEAQVIVGLAKPIAVFPSGLMMFIEPWKGYEEEQVDIQNEALWRKLGLKVNYNVGITISCKEGP